MSLSHSSRPHQIIPIIELLEVRRLLSADLTGVFANSVPAVLETGDQNHVAINISNIGDSAAVGTETINLFASGNTAGDDVLLSSFTRHLNLKPGHAGKVNFRFAERASLADGTYSLIGSIDSSAIPNAIGTQDVFVSTSPVTVSQPFADLSAERVVAPSQPIIINGDSVQGRSANMTLVNRGTAAAKGLVSISFYLSTSSTLDSRAQLAGSLPDVSINLKPGHAEVFRTALKPAIGTAGGEYFLFADAVPQAGIVQKNIGDEVGLAPRQVLIIRNRPVTTGGDNQYPTQDDADALIACTIDSSEAAETSAPAEAPPSTQPTDNTTQPSTTPSDVSSSDDVGQSSNDSQTQPATQPDQSNAPADSQPSSNDSSQPSTDNSSTDSTPATDPSADTSPADSGASSG